MSEDIWKQYEVEEDAPPVHLVLGTLHVWIQSRNDEVWIAHQYEEEIKTPLAKDDAAPEGLAWSRWAYDPDIEKLYVQPAFPDLPVVISSEYPLTIPPGIRIEVFTRIPIWMRIGSLKSGYVLREIPSVKLSKTWFGTPLEGELCYWSPTKARRSLKGVEPKEFYVNCPIRITNKGTKDLNFERFCLRVERLGIHRHNNELWAGETKIVHHEDDSESDITMTGKLPDSLGKSELLTKPRNPIHRSLATRTFKMLFDDTFITTR